MVSPPADPRLRVRISAVSGRVSVTAESRGDVVVDRGGVAETARDGSVEIRASRPSDAVDVRCPAGSDVIVGTVSGKVELARSARLGRRHVAERLDPRGGGRRG